MKACENCKFCTEKMQQESKGGYYRIKCSKFGWGWSDNKCNKYKPQGE